jgi:hypothetical protein
MNMYPINSGKPEHHHSVKLYRLTTGTNRKHSVLVKEKSRD